MSRRAKATLREEAAAREAKRQEIIAIIDELGEVERKFRLWTPGVNPHAARLAELRATVNAWYANELPEASFVVEGEQYRLQVKACEFRRDVTAEAQHQAFEATRKKGIDPFLIFKATQESIQRVLGEGFLNAIAPKKRTGPRKHVIVAKAAPEVMKPKEKAA